MSKLAMRWGAVDIQRRARELLGVLLLEEPDDVAQPWAVLDGPSCRRAPSTRPDFDAVYQRLST
jgi:hypothetical protein